MYDLLTDPHEEVNLAFHDPNVPQELNVCNVPGSNTSSCAVLTPFQQQQKNRLHAKLQATVATTLRPRLGVKWKIGLNATTSLVQLTELDRSDAGGAMGFPVGEFEFAFFFSLFFFSNFFLKPLFFTCTSSPDSTTTKNHAGGANANFPIGGFFGILPNAVSVNPTAPIELVYTPLNGTSFLVPPGATAGGFTAGGPCFASVQWSVLSSAGSIFGTAKAACRPTADGGMAFSGTASIYAGTSSFRGLRAQGLKFAAFSAPPGQNGTASITGTAETKSLAAA
jgi:hypothetical protein